MNRQSNSPIIGSLVLNPYLDLLVSKIDANLEKELVKVNTPASEKYTDTIKLTVPLSKYLKAKYNPNKDADPMNGNL